MIYQTFWYNRTMLGKKGSCAPLLARTYRKELQCLYARRLAIDALIRSLEEYDRFRARTMVSRPRRKTA